MGGTDEQSIANGSRCTFGALGTLILGGCKVDDAVCRTVAASCPSLTSLDMWNCDRVTNEGALALLCSGAPLEQLNLRECIRIGGVVVAELAKALHTVCLHTLDVSSTGLLDDDHLLPFLQRQQSRLTCLNCGGPLCKISEVCLDALPTSLTALDLTECFMIRSFMAVVNLRMLTSLSLDSCNIDVDELVCICRA